MSTPKPPPVPSENGRPVKPAPAAVIRRLDGAAETMQERLIKKHLPAWVASGMLNLGIIAVAYFISQFAKPAEAKPIEKVLATSVEKESEEAQKDLTNEDPGLESNLEAALPDIEREAEKTVDAAVSSDPIGQPDAKTEDTVAYAPPGALADNLASGAPGDSGPALSADMAGGGGGLMAASMSGRSGATKSRLLREGGGNEASELAVAHGLSWLARQQKPNGCWIYDGSHAEDTISSTGMALLPFLAAGQTHRTGKYATVVKRGLQYLISNLKSDGQFNGKKLTMYSHGIGTIALCEAYGMTKDRGFLLRPAQAAINFMCVKQGPDGSWGYSPGTSGDTSIVGWQIQALKAAQLSKDIVVPDATINKAIAFLDKVSSGSRKAKYGYTGPTGAPGTSLTAVGLLCRYYVSKWGPGNAGLAEGVEGLMKRAPGKAPSIPDMYYYYYATQVVHFSDGPEWKDWNEGPMKGGKRGGGMRDWLMSLQSKKEGPTYGSWEKDGSQIGSSCGRLGTTCLSLLTLEVYYRHLPLYKRDQGGLKVLDAVK